VWIREDHLVRLNTPGWPIVKKYREGKVKKNPMEGSEIEHETVIRQAMGGVKLWPCACGRMSRRLIGGGEVKEMIRSRSEGESEEGVRGHLLWTRTRVI
jgi:hypothetical protein